MLPLYIDWVNILHTYAHSQSVSRHQNHHHAAALNALQDLHQMISQSQGHSSASAWTRIHVTSTPINYTDLYSAIIGFHGHIFAFPAINGSSKPLKLWLRWERVDSPCIASTAKTETAPAPCDYHPANPLSETLHQQRDPRFSCQRIPPHWPLELQELRNSGILFQLLRFFANLIC